MCGVRVCGARRVARVVGVRVIARVDGVGCACLLTVCIYVRFDLTGSLVSDSVWFVGVHRRVYRYYDLTSTLVCDSVQSVGVTD